MGYRFSLETANIVANLSLGRVLACYRDIMRSSDDFDKFMEFLNLFMYNMYSDEKWRYQEGIDRVINSIRCYERGEKNFKDGEYPLPGVYTQNTQLTQYDPELLEPLRELSELFARCRLKALLLPPIKKKKTADCSFMTRESTLKELVKLHPGDSCLILQPTISPASPIIFDAFPFFDVALRQADLWPAVLFWNQTGDHVFAPVSSRDELINLFRIARWELYNPIEEIKRHVYITRKPNHYIFHLSDLHFGAYGTAWAEPELKRLVHAQLSKLEPNDSVHFVVTGDAVDSPKESNEDRYEAFTSYLNAMGVREPVRVLGNHDVNAHGLALNSNNQRLIDLVGDFPKIHVIEESKVILLLFNSNTSGKLARGKIGKRQMSKMRKLLDEIPGKDGYQLIAVLHHHVCPVLRPKSFEKRWYERLIPEELMDATLELIDADVFLKWLQEQNVKYLLHGHKHIPYFNDENDTIIFGCGSSTGKVCLRDQEKTCISYNLIKINQEGLTCTFFTQSIPGVGAKATNPITPTNQELVIRTEVV